MDAAPLAQKFTGTTEVLTVCCRRHAPSGAPLPRRTLKEMAPRRRQSGECVFRMVDVAEYAAGIFGSCGSAGDAGLQGTRGALVGARARPNARAEKCGPTLLRRAGGIERIVTLTVRKSSRTAIQMSDSPYTQPQPEVVHHLGQGFEAWGARQLRFPCTSPAECCRPLALFASCCAFARCCRGQPQ